MILSLGVASAADSCEIKSSCSTGEYSVMGLSSLTNAHGELWDQGNYGYALCCDFGTGNRTCSSHLHPEYDDEVPANKIIGLSFVTNAHAEVTGKSNYEPEVCYENLACINTSSCDSDYSMELISLSDYTNAHIGNYEDYGINICCKQIECRADVSFCSNYDESECNYDPCDKADASVPPEVDCSDPTIFCYCEWIGGECGPRVDIRNLKICGDGSVDRPNDAEPPFNEQCDPNTDGDGIPVFSPGEDSCVALTTNLQMDDYTSGTLSCKSDCTFDISGCIGAAPICGDDVVNQIGEVCDGNDLQTRDCEYFGYGGGTLDCDSSCEFDTSSCTNPGDKICGDSNIDTPNDGNINEQCDGTNLNGEASDCSTVDDYASGTLSCYSSCTFNYEQCTGPNPPTCGDDAVNVFGEECDGIDLKGRSCGYFGYTGGILGCSNCKFDLSQCLLDQPIGAGGSCYYDEQTGDNCDDGFLTYSWIGTWTGEGEKPDWCEDGSNTVPCPAQIQLPFFGTYSIVLIIVLIALIYVILTWRKKKFNSKGKVKKK